MTFDGSVQGRVDAALAAAGVAWTVLRHEVGSSAAEIATLRGTALHEGGKALLMRGDRGLGLVVVALPGDRRLDNRAFRSALGLRRYRFATAEELAAHTGLRPGTVPPFGRPVFDLPLIVDATLAASARIAFTPGRSDQSYLLSTEDWLRAAAPWKVLAVSQA